MNKITPEWSAPTKYIVSVGLVIFGLYLVYLSNSVLTLVILAGLFAFLLLPIVDFLEAKLKLPRIAAVMITYILVGVALFLSPLIFVNPIIDGFNFLARIDYQVLVQDLLQWFRNTLIAIENISFVFGPINFDLRPVIDPILQMLQTTETQFTPTLPSFATIIDSLQSAATMTVGVATNVAGTVFSGVFTAVVLIFSSIYISTDAHHFASRLLAVTPPTYRDEIAILLRRLAAIWRAYFRGQLNLMVIIGTVTWLGNTALGMPGAFALGVIAGVMEIIPSLGPFLAAVPAVIVALIQGSSTLDVSNWVFALIIIGFYILVQQFENTFVVPRILGEAVDLHPLIVILGVVIGANVGGIIGALLAAPIIASGREIVRYLYMKILNEPPFPPEAEPPPRPSLRVYLRFALTKLRYYGTRLSPPPTALPPAEEEDVPPQ